MLKRTCFFCEEEFEVKYASSNRKNCGAHKGVTTKNHRLYNGVLQRRCAKCRKWKDVSSYYAKGNNKSSWCKDCHDKESLTSQATRGWARKQELIEYSGGCCYDCGYRRNYAALTFHHLDPEKKSFGLDIRQCNGTKMETLKAEADKCVLLCQNCHMERHYPQYTNQDW